MTIDHRTIKYIEEAVETYRNSVLMPGGSNIDAYQYVVDESYDLVEYLNDKLHQYNKSWGCEIDNEETIQFEREASYFDKISIIIHFDVGENNEYKFILSDICRNHGCTDRYDGTVELQFDKINKGLTQRVANKMNDYESNMKFAISEFLDIVSDYEDEDYCEQSILNYIDSIVAPKLIEYYGGGEFIAKIDEGLINLYVESADGLSYGGSQIIVKDCLNYFKYNWYNIPRCAYEMNTGIFDVDEFVKDIEKVITKALRYRWDHYVS